MENWNYEAKAIVLASLFTVWNNEGLVLGSVRSMSDFCVGDVGLRLVDSARRKVLEMMDVWRDSDVF